MTKNEGIDKVVEGLSIRAHVIADEGHDQLTIMNLHSAILSLLET